MFDRKNVHFFYPILHLLLAKPAVISLKTEKMKKLLTLLCAGLTLSTVHGQLIDENFEGSLPGDWTQWSDDGISWTTSSDLSLEGFECAIVDKGTESDMGNTWLQTPWLDLTTLESPTLTFSTALVQNNFIPPSISLWYDTGAGWTFITNWGSEWADDVDNAVVTSGPFMSPLSPESVEWENDITVDLTPYEGFSSIRFSFGADFVNGGWVLLDSVLIKGEDVDNSGIDALDKKQLELFPNPTTGIVKLRKNQIQLNELKIYNTVGQLVENISIIDQGEFVSIDLSSADKGVYVLSTITTDGTPYSDFLILK